MSIAAFFLTLFETGHIRKYQPDKKRKCFSSFPEREQRVINLGWIRIEDGEGGHTNSMFSSRGGGYSLISPLGMCGPKGYGFSAVLVIK